MVIRLATFRAARYAVRAAVLVWLALGQTRAAVVVTPRCVTLQAGETCAFQVRLDPPDDPLWPTREERWRWELPDGGEGGLEADTGTYRAPSVAEVRQVRVRAVHPRDAGRYGEATVTVLPFEPFDLVAKVMGVDWVEPFSRDLPFLDLESLGRFPGRGRVRQETAFRSARVRAGYGLPCTLRWETRPGAQARLLSLLEGGQVVRRDVTGLEALERTFRTPVCLGTVEALHPLKEGGTAWHSRVQDLKVDVRGLFPFAGNTVAEGGHQDGAGLGARFREAFDVARAPRGGEWPSPVTWDLVVTDPQAHVLRRVTPDGRVTTLCGEPDQPGHRDSPGLLRRLASLLCRRDLPGPRFHRPTYLVRRDCPEAWPSDVWDLLVADSGNQVIRKVSASGQVGTLAGSPGLAGHRDAPDPAEALFDDPQGLAVDADGRVYVADRGNAVIRRIGRNGAVTTLAGSPGQLGTRDGQGRDARFSDLRGLAARTTRYLGGTLYALDGHAVRAISLPGGTVTTVAGQVQTPGFRDVDPAQPGDQALDLPCLRDPAGIRSLGGLLYLADRGNHAVRRLDLTRGALHTLVGDPGEPETRWGLLRDSIPGPLDPRFAAIGSPTGLTHGPEGAGTSLVVCAGRALGEICDRRHLRDRAYVEELWCFPARPGATCTAGFRVLTTGRQGVTARPIHYSVDFLDPDGRLAERREGRGDSLGICTVEGAFTARGQGAVVLRCVTDQGVAAGAALEVPVD